MYNIPEPGVELSNKIAEMQEYIIIQSRNLFESWLNNQQQWINQYALFIGSIFTTSKEIWINYLRKMIDARIEEQKKENRPGSGFIF